MLTRKDYFALAEILGVADADATISESSPVEHVEKLTRAIVAFLENDNPRFDKEKFFEEIDRVSDRRLFT